MLLKKKGIPEEGELVLCTVTKILYNSVFVNLDEYNKQAMIHISEISPGRIRNIRDFVREGKKIVCVVLRINREKGYIDLSLRRVNEGQKRKKLDGIKQEQKAEKMIDVIAKESNIDELSLRKDISEKILKEYDSLNSCFSDVVGDDVSLEGLGIDKTIAKKLTDFIKEKMKPQKVTIKGKLRLTSYDSNGVDVVKEALEKAEDAVKGGINIRYAGAGTYNIIVESLNYKDAEKIMEKAVNAAIGFIEDKKGNGSFERND